MIAELLLGVAAVSAGGILLERCISASVDLCVQHARDEDESTPLLADCEDTESGVLTDRYNTIQQPDNRCQRLPDSSSSLQEQLLGLDAPCSSCSDTYEHSCRNKFADQQQHPRCCHVVGGNLQHGNASLLETVARKQDIFKTTDDTVLDDLERHENSVATLLDAMQSSTQPPRLRHPQQCTTPFAAASDHPPISSRSAPKPGTCAPIAIHRSHGGRDGVSQRTVHQFCGPVTVSDPEKLDPLGNDGAMKDGLISSLSAEHRVLSTRLADGCFSQGSGLDFYQNFAHDQEPSKEEPPRQCRKATSCLTLDELRPGNPPTNTPASISKKTSPVITLRACLSRTRLADDCVHMSLPSCERSSYSSGGLLSRAQPPLNNRMTVRKVRYVDGEVHLEEAVLPQLISFTRPLNVRTASRSVSFGPKFGKDVVKEVSSGSSLASSWSPVNRVQLGLHSKAGSAHSPPSQGHTNNTWKMTNPGASTIASSKNWSHIPAALCVEAVNSGFHPPIRVGPPIASSNPEAASTRPIPQEPDARCDTDQIASSPVTQEVPVPRVTPQRVMGDLDKSQHFARSMLTVQLAGCTGLLPDGCPTAR